MPATFDLDASLEPALAVPPAERHLAALVVIAKGMGYSGRFCTDVTLCDPCMNAWQLDKGQAWMGHTDEDGGAQCDWCRSYEARLCFTARQGL